MTTPAQLEEEKNALIHKIFQCVKDSWTDRDILVEIHDYEQNMARLPIVYNIQMYYELMEEARNRGLISERKTA
jgi:hypothetical protein